jgi:HMG box factor
VAANSLNAFDSYPDYKYQPVYRRTNVVRRKMKPDPVEDKKCTVLASLLMEGKEGVELEAAAAQEVHAVNKKRLRVQKALAARYVGLTCGLGI